MAKPPGKGPYEDADEAQVWKITTPNPAYTDTFLGVKFERGRATTEDIIVARRLQFDFGYTVEPEIVLGERSQHKPRFTESDPNYVGLGDPLKDLVRESPRN